MKTNALRALDKLSIPYETRQYEVDPDDLGAEKVAQAIGLAADQVFKTLVLRGTKRGVVLGVIAAEDELDLKAIARLAEDRAMELVALKEVQPLTGYIRGGVTALACKKPYPVFVDAKIHRHGRIAVSAGIRGMQVVLDPEDYVRATGAVVGPIARSKEVPQGEKA